MPYGTLNAGAITPGSGNTLTVSETVNFTGTTSVQNLSVSEGNITNVANIALDTISSDAGTTIGVTLGTDAGDDFNVGSGKLIVEGDTGNIGIGITPPASYTTNMIHLFIGRGAVIYADTDASSNFVDYNQNARWNGAGSDAYINDGMAQSYSQYAGKHIFKVAPSGSANGAVTWKTAMTVSQDAYVGIGRTPSYRLDVQNSQASQVVRIINTHASAPNGLDIQFSGATPDDTTQWFIQGGDSAGAEFYIYSDGSFSQVSDRRVKENIVDVESMLDKVNSLRVVNYNRISDKDKGLHIGAIAQEVIKIFPHLIRLNPAVDAVAEVTDEEGNITIEAVLAKEERLMMYKIGLIFPLIKAVQELSTKVTALEAS